MRMKKNRIWVHVAFWLTYLMFESYVQYEWMTGPTYASMPPFRRWCLAVVGEIALLPVKIPLSYFIFYLLDQLTEKPMRAAMSIIAAIVSFVAGIIGQIYLIYGFVVPYIYGNVDENQSFWKPARIMWALFDIVLVVGLAVAAKQYRLYHASRKKEIALQKEKLEAELKFLRAQTNPHFLVNTLNNIYALSRKKSDDTADVVMKLSKLLRFMLYESRNDHISITDELRVLTDYIELEKIRYNERLTINFSQSIDDPLQPIGPLILLPFVENAFKHGVSETRFDSFVDIRVRLEQGLLNFQIENSKDDEEDK